MVRSGAIRQTWKPISLPQWQRESSGATTLSYPFAINLPFSDKRSKQTEI